MNSWTLALQVLQQLHPLGLRDDWADKLANQEFVARNTHTTFEHYLQASHFKKMNAVLLQAHDSYLQVENASDGIHI